MPVKTTEKIKIFSFGIILKKHLCFTTKFTTFFFEKQKKIIRFGILNRF